MTGRRWRMGLAHLRAATVAGAARGWARIKSAAASPFGLLSGIFPYSNGEPPVRGTRDLLEGYEVMPWLRAVAGKVAASVATTEWQLFSVRRGGRAVRMPALQRACLTARMRTLTRLRRAGELREEDDHLFHEALARPNPLMSGDGLTRITQVALDLVGDAYWLKARNGLGAVAGFWYVPPHWVIEHPTPSRDSFRASFAAWQREIPRSEIVWFHDPAPANPYARGSGLGWALLDELEVDEYAAKMAKVLFFNRALPNFLVMGTEVEAAEMRRLKREWLAEHAGFWRAGKGHFLAGKVEVKEFTQQTLGQQLMYPSLRTAQRDVVFQTWGVPPEIFGVLENSNRATIGAALYHYELLTIAPRVEFMRAVLQSQVIEEYDGRLVLAYAPRIPDDDEYELSVRRAAPWAWPADEWRAMVGDQELADGAGKMHLVPLNSWLTPSLLDDSRRPASGASTDSRLADLEDAAKNGS